MNVRKLYPCIILAALLAGACGKDKEAVPDSAAPVKAVAKAPAAPKAAEKPDPSAKAAAKTQAKTPTKASAKTQKPSVKKKGVKAAAKKSKKKRTAKAKAAKLPGGAGAGTAASAKTKAASGGDKDFQVEVTRHWALGKGAGPGGRGVAVSVKVRNNGTELLPAGNVLARLHKPDASYRYRYNLRFKDIPAGNSQLVHFEVKTTKPLTGKNGLDFEARVKGRRSNRVTYAFDAATLLPKGEAVGGARAKNSEPFQMGDVMADFAFSDLSGKKVSLSSLPGKTFLVFICTDWSPHCNRLAQLTPVWHKRYGDLGLNIVEIFFGDPAKIKAFAEKHGLKHTVLVATQDEINNLFKLRGIPVFYLMGTDRAIEWRMAGYLEGLRLEFEVEEALEAAMD